MYAGAQTDRSEYGQSAIWKAIACSPRFVAKITGSSSQPVTRLIYALATNSESRKSAFGTSVFRSIVSFPSCYPVNPTRIWNWG